ncbi:ABC transporter permease [archaeon]|nr:ABC transporter permease [archaeon]
MVSERLVQLVASGLARNVSKNDIMEHLLKKGFSHSEIKEAFEQSADTHFVEKKKFHESEEFHGKKRPPKWQLFIEIMVGVILLIILMTVIAFAFFSYWKGEQMTQAKIAVLDNAIVQAQANRTNALNSLNGFSCNNASCEDQKKLIVLHLNDSNALLAKLKSVQNTDLGIAIASSEGALLMKGLNSSQDYIQNNENALTALDLKERQTDFDERYTSIRDLVVEKKLEDLRVESSIMPEYIPHETVEKYYLGYFSDYCEKRYARFSTSMQSYSWAEAAYDAKVVEYCFEVYGL